jgi:hypothetical protein
MFHAFSPAAASMPQYRNGKKHRTSKLRYPKGTLAVLLKRSGPLLKPVFINEK